VSQPIDGVIPPDQSSIGIWTYRVAGELAAAGWDVSVYAKRRRDDPPPGEHRGVRYRFARTSIRAWGKLGAVAGRYFAPRTPLYSAWWYYLDYVLPIAIRLRRERPEIIHVQNFTSFVPVIRRLNPDAVLVLHMACEWLSQLDAERMRARVAACDLVLGVSDHITGLVAARFPELADRCLTVPNGVDTTEFTIGDPGAGEGASNGPGPLLYVGRISPEKGLHDLLAAFTIVARQDPTARLVLAGPDGAAPADFIVGVSDDDAVVDLARFYEVDYGSFLREQVPDDLAARVEFTGAMSHGDVAALVRSAGVVVNPSYSESFGMSIVEAMASGVPVVATRVGGMTGTVDDGETGFLVERGDVDGLAEGMLTLLRDDGLRRRMGRTARERVERFTWHAVRDQLLRAYDRALEAT
jgi:glycosyltransferase involved in cell wall biosynthesis